MGLHECLKQIQSMSASDLRLCLSAIVREFEKPSEYRYGDILKVHKDVLEVLNEFDINPATDDEEAADGEQPTAD